MSQIKFILILVFSFFLCLPLGFAENKEQLFEEWKKLNTTGQDFRKSQQFEDARVTFEKALVLANKINEPQVTLANLNNLSTIDTQLKQYNKAEQTFTKARSMTQKNRQNSNAPLCIDHP